ncbi:hypothetical protein GCM10023331_35990 [Algivirga pacifica]|uniref:Uncharacterized protein n=2 Tax=Algivirga pacifica TaxID=1162670 RepID=A0ABP9DK48_9BACT
MMACKPQVCPAYYSAFQPTGEYEDYFAYQFSPFGIEQLDPKEKPSHDLLVAQKTRWNGTLDKKQKRGLFRKPKAKTSLRKEMEYAITYPTQKEVDAYDSLRGYELPDYETVPDNTELAVVLKFKPQPRQYYDVYYPANPGAAQDSTMDGMLAANDSVASAQIGPARGADPFFDPDKDQIPKKYQKRTQQERILDYYNFNPDSLPPHDVEQYHYEKLVGQPVDLDAEIIRSVSDTVKQRKWWQFWRPRFYKPGDGSQADSLQESGQAVPLEENDGSESS